MSFTAPTNGLYRCDSTSRDVYLNLAREEYLLDALPEGSRALLFYINESSVVMGKHQNPWRECSVRELGRRGIPLARRISGGGTVYHDAGNLNFSFVLPREGFDRRANLEIVVGALRRVGVKATISERHDLLLEGRKISGNAFCFRRDRALHHGTLLVRSELESLRGALVGTPGIESFAVQSNPSPVVNIADLQPSIDIQTIAESIAEAAGRDWRLGSGQAAGLKRIDETELAVARVEELERRNRAAEWLLDRTPKFTITLAVPRSMLGRPAVGNGLASLRLEVERGTISAVSLLGDVDAVEEGARVTLQNILGLRFDSAEIAAALETASANRELALWFREQNF